MAMVEKKLSNWSFFTHTIWSYVPLLLTGFGAHLGLSKMLNTDWWCPGCLQIPIPGKMCFCDRCFKEYLILNKMPGKSDPRNILPNGGGKIVIYHGGIRKNSPSQNKSKYLLGGSRLNPASQAKIIKIVVDPLLDD